jgi:hypothetical protein
MAAAQRKTVLKVARKALLAAVASLPDAEALERLTMWQDAEGPGLRRRALLAARIALMRRLLAAEPVVQEVPPPPAPEPVIEEPPPPPAKPAKVMRTTMTTFSMEDAAKLLMSAATPDDADAAAGFGDDAPSEDVAAVEVAEAEFLSAPWVDVAAQINAAPEEAEVPAPAEVAEAEHVAEQEPEPVVAPDAVASTAEITDVNDAEAALNSLPEEDGQFDDPTPSRRAERVTPVLPMDIGAQLAAMAQEDDSDALEALAAFATAPKKAGLPPSLDDSLAALGGLGDLGGGTAAPAKGTRKAGKGKPVAVEDMGAQFAALDAVREAEVVEMVKGPIKPAITIDLSAQFAALQDPDD